MNTLEPKRPESHLDRERIIHIIGSIDDEIILKIISTGASEANLLEARERLERPGEVASETQHQPTGVVAQLVEILRTIEFEWDEAHDRVSRHR